MERVCGVKGAAAWLKCQQRLALVWCFSCRVAGRHAHCWVGGEKRSVSGMQEARRGAGLDVGGTKRCMLDYHSAEGFLVEPNKSVDWYDANYVTAKKKKRSTS